jgi:hypothetical protein
MSHLYFNYFGTVASMKIIDGIIFVSLHHLAAAKTLSQFPDIEVQLVIDVNKVTSKM